MLLTKELKIRIGCRTFNHFISKGYVVNKVGQEITVNVKDMNHGSHFNVDVCCDYCGALDTMSVKTYMLRDKSIINKDACKKCNYEKTKESNLIIYGVENTFQSEDKKEIIKKTNLERYGFENAMQNDKVINRLKNSLFIKYKRQIELNKKNADDYAKYRKLVDKITLKTKKVLISNWSGFDFYDGEYIRDNFSLSCYDKKYPTIDHKISVKYGFDNNIDPSYISSIDNLCITKLTLNCSKNDMNYLEFLEKIKII